MKTKIFTLFCFICLYACQQPEPIDEYQIIPQPQQIDYSPGFFKIKNNPVISYTDELNNEALLLQEYLLTDYKINASVKQGNSGNIKIILDNPILSDKPEGYQLTVSKKNIEIKAGTSAGIANGIQTLRQLIKKRDNVFAVQRATITDYPAFSWRAFMLDEARHFKGKEVVLSILDEMARLKMNTFHWHLTNDQGWRIEIKKYPRLTEIGAFRDSTEMPLVGSGIFDGKPHGGFYTQKDIREIVDYASKRHITIVPEISMPGHSCAAIAAYPELGTSGKKIKVPGKFGVHYEVLKVSDPKVKDFLEDVIDEVITLFPGPVIHIGGDEIKYDQWKASPEIRAYMKEKGLKTPAELQIYFTNEISNMLDKKGKKMMGWNEITGDKLHDYQSVEDTKDIAQPLAKGTIVHFWKGDPELIKKTVSKGYNVVNSYHSFTYLNYSYSSIPLSKAYSFNPVPEGLSPEESSKILGLGCQMWGEVIPTIKDMTIDIYPRIAAYAETGWTENKNKDYKRFLKSLENLKKFWTDKGLIIGEPTE